jgi:hypothetical protein
MASEKLFIVAGNKREYDFFIRKKADELAKTGYPISLSHFVYVSDFETLRGHRDVHGWFYGSYLQREDLQDIVMQIRIINNIPSSKVILPYEHLLPSSRT